MTDMVHRSVRVGRRFVQLNVTRTRFENCRVHDECKCDPWTYCYAGSTWPGTEAHDWIEYLPCTSPSTPTE